MGVATTGPAPRQCTSTDADMPKNGLVRNVSAADPDPCGTRGMTKTETRGLDTIEFALTHGTQGLITINRPWRSAAVRCGSSCSELRWSFCGSWEGMIGAVLGALTVVTRRTRGVMSGPGDRLTLERMGVVVCHGSRPTNEVIFDQTREYRNLWDPRTARRGR